MYGGSLAVYADSYSIYGMTEPRVQNTNLIPTGCVYLHGNTPVRPMAAISHSDGTKFYWTFGACLDAKGYFC
jgi:hypothetical protein